MGTFIEDYLMDPHRAISSALEQLNRTNWQKQIDNDAIYAELATGEFRLYETMILNSPSDDSPRAESFVAAV